MNFIFFISRQQEIIKIKAQYPEEFFLFVSFHPVNPDVVVINQNDPVRAFLKIQKKHQENPFAGVLNIREKYVRTAAALLNYLKMPAFVENAEWVRDKWKQRLKLSQAAKTQSVYLIKDQSDLEHIPNDFFPCVLKPRFGFNSRSVTLIQNPTVLKSCYLRNKNYYGAMKNEDTTNSDFIVESFLDGTEHTVEAFVQAGKVVFSILSDKASMAAPYFVETGDFMPSRLPESVQTRIIQAVQEAVVTLGIRFGWSHSEVKWDGQNVGIIEVAARMGGGYFGQMIQMVYGIDRVRVLMDALHGKPLRFPKNALTTVKGHRMIGKGLSLVMLSHKTEQEIEQSKSIKLIWPDNSKAIKKLIVGPPFGYKNTLFEYFICHANPNETQKIFEKTVPQLRPRQWRLFRWGERVIWAIVLLIHKHRRKKYLDV